MGEIIFFGGHALIVALLIAAFVLNRHLNAVYRARIRSAS
jgi:hypothetical protein